MTPAEFIKKWSRYQGKETSGYPRVVAKDAASAASLKKRTLTNLYNERPTWLAQAHEKLDAAVAVAYGWPVELTDELILERLLALNHVRAAQEISRPQSTTRTS